MPPPVVAKPTQEGNEKGGQGQGQGEGQRQEGGSEKAAPKKVEPVQPTEFRDAVTAVQFTPDGKQLLSVGCDNMLRVWNVADGKELKKLGPTPDWIFGLALSRDKKAIATAGYGGHLYLWDLNAGKSTFAALFAENHHLLRGVQPGRQGGGDRH